MKKKSLVQSFNNAIEGIIASIKVEKHMRIHVIVASLVVIACFIYDLTVSELFAVLISITLVITAEMINTSIEKAIDAVIDYEHPLIKISKDVAAGAVLVTAINSVIVGYIVFWNRLKPITYVLIGKIKRSNPHIIFLSLIIVTLITIIIKVINGKGTPLKGGMPSGHSAIAFSIATIIAFFTEDPLSVFLGYLLALIVGQSRVDSETHSLIEVILGGLLGIIITMLILKTIFT